METLELLKRTNKKDITLKRVLNAIGRRIAGLPERVLFYWPFGFSKKNRDKLKALKDKHKGQRCFIVCNGPSLKEINFDLLKDEITFGMNRIYLMKEQNGFVPTYFGCIDKNSQTLQFHEDMDKLEMPCFFAFGLRKYFSKKDNQIFLGGRFSHKFQTDASKLLGNAKSITYKLMQLAYYMGFQEVYIIGKDHSYNTTEKAGTGIRATGNEENHFIKGYYKPGMRWDAPDYIAEEFEYEMTREAFEKAGRVIKNATVGGKLEVFERVDFYSLFPKK